MNYDLILIRYGELALKSDKVRRRFEKKLVKNIQASIEGEVKRDQGRIYIEPVNFDDPDWTRSLEVSHILQLKKQKQAKRT